MRGRDERDERGRRGRGEGGNGDTPPLNTNMMLGKDFSDGSRCEEGPDGFAYCSTHYVEQFAPKCGGCGLPILGTTNSILGTARRLLISALGTVINALEKAWHPEHFACATCKQPLSNSFFHGDDLIPYCEKHYYASMNLLCVSCDKPIVTGFPLSPLPSPLPSPSPLSPLPSPLSPLPSPLSPLPSPLPSTLYPLHAFV